MANNRELSQFGSFVSVNDANKKITIGSTITKVLTDELEVLGVSTLGVTSTTNLTAENLRVSGITTLGITSISDLTLQNLNVSEITTLGFLTGTNAYFTGIVTANTFVVLGPTSLDNLQVNTLKVTGSTTLGVTSATNLKLETLDVSGISTFTDGPVLIGTRTSTGITSQRLQVSGNAYISGNLGIGTTNPEYLLDVRGYSKFTGQTEIDNLKVTGIATIAKLGVTDFTTTKDLSVAGFSTFTNTIRANGGAYIDNIQIGITNDNTIDTTTGSLTLASDTNITKNLVVLGIGTTNAGEALQVDGNIRVGNSNTSNYIAFRGVYGDGAGGGIQIPYTHAFIGERTYVPGTEISELLIFKGNDNGIVPNGPDRIRLAATGGIVFDTTSGDDGLSGTFEGVGISTLLTTKMILTKDGNLGIGTSTPTSKLTVQDDVKVSGTTATSILNVGTGGTIITTTSIGLVGIGTTNPTSKLHVVGDVRVGVNSSQGVILTSPDGTTYRLLVSNLGVVSTVVV